MKNSELVNIVLNDIYNIVKGSLSKDVYSFKGGFILKRVLDSRDDLKDIRRTTDIDMSILDEVTFNDIGEALLPYLKNLENRGIIHSFKFKTPDIKDGRNMSGGVKLYVKPEGANSKKRVLCGIDMSIHPLNYGLIVLNDGSSVYTLERMLSDKLCVMFSSEDKLLRRVRDVTDIYLIMKYLGSISNLNVDNVVFCTKERMKESNLVFSKVSVLEKLVTSKEGYLRFKNSFENLIDSNKVAKSIVSKEDIDKVLKEVILFINFISGKL